MDRKNYIELVNSWKKFNQINEAFTSYNIKDYEERDDFGFEDESQSNYDIVANKNKNFMDDFDKEKDYNKIEKFNMKDQTFGVNSKIFSIIKKLEDYVDKERELKQDSSIKGKIVLYEDEYDGFIKFDFSGFESRWNEVDDLVKSTMEFEGTDPDWGQGYGKGAYRIMLTHKSTLGVSALLFEILLEFVSGIRGKGICSDRSSITIEAQKKWHIYANRSDIELEQLDINKDDSENFGLEQLTPDDVSDDTSQAISIRHKGDEWYDSIFSKVFKKKGIQTIKYIANNSDQLELSIAIINPGELTSKI